MNNEDHSDDDEEQQLLSKPLLLNDNQNFEESKGNKRSIDFDVDDSRSSLVEPPSHAETKSLCQKLFPKLAEGTKLTKEELQVYYHFKVEHVQNYDQSNPSHELELRVLAEALLGLDVALEIQATGMKDERWRRFGF